MKKWTLREFFWKFKLAFFGLSDGSGTIKRVLKKSHPIKRRREEEKGEFTHFYATHSSKPAKNLRLQRTTCAPRVS
jgi:hypothetical protein